jgi:PPM family protein phosphatase
MTIEISVGGGQLLGSRALQEDAYLIKSPKRANAATAPTLLIVADGIGGQHGGDVASQLAVKSFAAEVAKQLKPPVQRESQATAPADATLSIPDVLSQALNRANKKLATAKARNPELAPMGSTFVAALIDADKLWWISVGDSHLYLVRKRKLERCNASHTYGAYLDDEAFLGNTVEQATPSQRKRLTSSLEGAEIPRVDCPKTPLQLEPGDTLILASDGLDALSEGRIVFVVDTENSAQECAAELLDAVTTVAHPRQDNTTVVVFRYGSAPVQRSAPVEVDFDFTKTIQ